MCRPGSNSYGSKLLGGGPRIQRTSLRHYCSSHLLFLSRLYSIVKQWIDPVTLEKISILRGKEEIKHNMELRIPLDQLPPEYGGKSAPLGESIEEKTLRALIMHNNAVAAGDYSCGGTRDNCRFCSFVPARAY